MAAKDFGGSVSFSVFYGISHLHIEGKMTDVKVNVHGKVFALHRVVLASVSDYFKELFQAREKQENVFIGNAQVTSTAFALFVDIVYGKKDKIETKQTAMDVIKAAKYLRIKFLIEPCQKFLVDEVNNDTCLDLWQFADSLELKDLEKEALQTAVCEFETVRESQAFLGLPSRFLRLLLSRRELTIFEEDHLCQALRRWVQKNPKEREPHLPELLPFICFTNLSERYLMELRQTFAQDFTAVRDYAEEATTFQLERQKINSLLRSEILARTDRRYPPSVRADEAVISIGGSGQPASFLQIASLLTADNRDVNQRQDAALQASSAEAAEGAGKRPLKSPGNIGMDFASCLWRNELYVSGGSTQPTFFAVYNAGTNKWEELQQLPLGRQKHCMVAANRVIYLLGGQTTSHPTAKNLAASPKPQPKEKEKNLVHEVGAYNTKLKTWERFAHLSQPRTDFTAATLGHRIYLFGGKSAADQQLSTVECVDTLTGSVYVAGRLHPTPSCVRALGDGGAIFVVLGSGEVLSLRENSNLADEKEQHLLQLKEEEKDSSSWLSFFSNIFQKPRENFPDTVAFRKVLDIPKWKKFTACLHGDQLYVNGGQRVDGGQRTGPLKVSLQDGVCSEFVELASTGDSAHLHVMRIPKLTDKLHFLFMVKFEKLQDDGKRLSAADVRIHNFEWCLQISNNNGYLAHHLTRRQTDDGRNWKVDTSISVRLVAADCEGSVVKAGPTEFTFKGSGPVECGPVNIAKIADLDRRLFVNEDGEMKIDAWVSITSPPQVEPLAK